MLARRDDGGPDVRSGLADPAPRLLASPCLCGGESSGRAVRPQDDWLSWAAGVPTVTCLSALLLRAVAACVLAARAKGPCGHPLGEFFPRPWGWVGPVPPERSLSPPWPTARCSGPCTGKELVSVILCPRVVGTQALLRSRVLGLSASHPLAYTIAV